MPQNKWFKWLKVLFLFMCFNASKQEKKKNQNTTKIVNAQG